MTPILRPAGLRFWLITLAAVVGMLVTAVTDVVTLDAPQIEPPTPGLRDRIGMGIARTPGAPPTVLLDARVVFD